MLTFGPRDQFSVHPCWVLPIFCKNSSRDFLQSASKDSSRVSGLRLEPGHLFFSYSMETTITFVYEKEAPPFSKRRFERFVEYHLSRIVRKYRVRYMPSPLTIILESGTLKDPSHSSYGGTWLSKQKLYLQLYNLRTPKGIRTFLREVVIHELFHLVVPIVTGNSCWSEGAVEFMTYLYLNEVHEALAEKIREFEESTDKVYKEHKYGYVEGFRVLVDMWKKNPRGIEAKLKAIIRDHTSSKAHYHRQYDKSMIDFSGLFTAKYDTPPAKAGGFLRAQSR